VTVKRRAEGPMLSGQGDPAHIKYVLRLGSLMTKDLRLRAGKLQADGVAAMPPAGCLTCSMRCRRSQTQAGGRAGRPTSLICCGLHPS